MLNQLRVAVETRQAISDLVGAAVAMRQSAAALTPPSAELEAAVGRVLRGTVALSEHMLRLAAVQRQNQRALVRATVKRTADVALVEHSYAAPAAPTRAAKRPAQARRSSRARSQSAVAEAARDAADQQVAVAGAEAVAAADPERQRRVRAAALEEQADARAKRVEEARASGRFVPPARKRLRAKAPPADDSSDDDSSSSAAQEE